MQQPGADDESIVDADAPVVGTIVDPSSFPRVPKAKAAKTAERQQLLLSSSSSCCSSGAG